MHPAPQSIPARRNSAGGVGSSAVAYGDIAERNVLVHADVLWQAEYTFGDDITHDLVGATGDAQCGRVEQGLFENAGYWHVLAHRGGCHADEIEAVGQNVLQLV